MFWIHRGWCQKINFIERGSDVRTGITIFNIAVVHLSKVTVEGIKHDVPYVAYIHTSLGAWRACKQVIMTPERNLNPLSSPFPFFRFI